MVMVMMMKMMVIVVISHPSVVAVALIGRIMIIVALLHDTRFKQKVKYYNNMLVECTWYMGIWW